ncbi:hypothetical protein BO94DRAFT_208616 [Aspergillus sclerotioniger CBS 115572]|uniref:Uncharacterized protein n=1 Tax=Aspergillus sclerotioniger CBS 115572 TaxID=1450535 RepID=A0A317VVZ4_9EURO|nr:hypothetical protein BO94DRAFT_208616 [Aspergillus sclerotioniger CBS 115572]PWY76090.1 hypothetical protein BO94DRAFT_208616 [Aspergillus sclerotioniger CBS 115572]
MPHTKTETGIRYPQDEEQRRRLRNTTQDQRASQRFQDASQSAGERAQAADPTSNWGPEEMFETTVDQYGNPVTDQWSFTDGAKMKKGVSGQDEADAFEAANNSFD